MTKHKLDGLEYEVGGSEYVRFWNRPIELQRLYYVIKENFSNPETRTFTQENVHLKIFNKYLFQELIDLGFFVEIEREEESFGHERVTFKLPYA